MPLLGERLRGTRLAGFLLSMAGVVAHRTVRIRSWIGSVAGASRLAGALPFVDEIDVQQPGNHL